LAALQDAGASALFLMHSPLAGGITRLKALGMLADQRIAVLAYHFPWPGVGHVARQGEGFRYYPEPMKMEL
jgi:hypothetical protein